MDKKTDIEFVKDFIFNDDVQSTLLNINDNLMDFNILKIVGMGNQEIKHSNILGWLFDNREHNLEYQILDNFLKKVIEENRQDNINNKILDALQSYIYLAKYKKSITVYREKDNIDLLIVDEKNKVVIAIENKVYASERTNGEDGGQLAKYEKIINTKYQNGYNKYFIFLTLDLEEPSRDNWLRADYEMIADIIKNILKTKEVSLKTKIILESYEDLLKRIGIVEDEKLEKLCKQIWDTPRYKNALEILNNYKPDIFSEISNHIQECLKKYSSSITMDDSAKRYIRFKAKVWTIDSQSEGSGWTSSKSVLLYEFQNGINGLFLKLIIGPTADTNFRKRIFDVSKKNNIFSPSNNLGTKWNQIWKKIIISKKDINEKNIEDLKMIVGTKIDKFFSNDFKNINKLLSEVMESD